MAKARFSQEARAASALDHPNVCTIYDVGETEEAALFIAMPWYEGGTLRDRLERGALPVDQAVDFARQIARGLGKAHRQGIVHRDVKPANLMVTPDDVVKILDFGSPSWRAPPASPAPAWRWARPPTWPPSRSRAATSTTGPTSGRSASSSTRCWPAAGRSLTATKWWPSRPSSSRIRRRCASCGRRSLPSWSGSSPLCSRKKPEERPRERRGRAGGAADLRRGFHTSVAGPRTTAVPVAAPRRRWLPWAAGFGLLLLLAAAAFLLLRDGPGTRGAPVALTFTRLTELRGAESFPSPLRRLFRLRQRGGRGLGHLLPAVRRRSQEPDRGLAGRRHPTRLLPRRLADRLPLRARRRRDLRHGLHRESPRRLTDVGYHPAWSPNGKTILYATQSFEDPRGRSAASEIWSVDLTSAERRLLIKADAVQPSWSPSGRRIAYWGVASGTSRRVVWTVAADGGEPVPVTQDATENASFNWSPVSASGRPLPLFRQRPERQHEHLAGGDR